MIFFKDTATTEIYTHSLHDALPICKRLLLKVDMTQEDSLWTMSLISAARILSAPSMEFLALEISPSACIMASTSTSGCFIVELVEPASPSTRELRCSSHGCRKRNASHSSSISLKDVECVRPAALYES